MVTPSEDFMQSERRRVRIEMRTQFALAIAAGVMTGGKIRVESVTGYRLVSECDERTVAAAIYDLAEALADEDQARRERDGR